MIYKYLIKKPEYTVQVVVEVLTSDTRKSSYNITDVLIFPKSEKEHISLLDKLKKSDNLVQIFSDEKKKEELFRKRISEYVSDEELALAIDKTYIFLRKFYALNKPEKYGFNLS